jgi:hypothetical protein
MDGSVRGGFFRDLILVFLWLFFYDETAGRKS